MSKSPEMKSFLEEVGKSFFKRSRKECLEKGICIICGGGAKEFDSELEEREWKISLMCQICQKDVFGG